MPELEKINKWGASNLVGILAIAAGLIAFYLTCKMVINFTIFLVGVALIYFGLVRLNIPAVNIFFDNACKKIKEVLKKI